MVSLEQLGNLHVLCLNSGTLLKNVLFQMLILLQTTQQTTSNKQQTTQQTTNSCHVTPTQVLPLGLVPSSLIIFVPSFSHKVTHLDYPLDVVQHHCSLHVGGGASGCQGYTTGGLLPKLVHLRKRGEQRCINGTSSQLCIQVCQNPSSFPDH